MRDFLIISCLTLIITVTMPRNVAGQDVSITAKFDTATVLIGDHLWFTVTLDKPAGLQFSVQQFRDTLMGKIEILRGPVSDTVRTSEREIITEKYLVTVFDSGRYEVAPVYAETDTESGIKRFYSDYTYLRVNRADIAPADTTSGFFDIIGPYRAPVTISEILPWVLAAAVIAVLLYLLIRFLRNRRKADEPAFVEIIREAPYIIAYRELEKLKSEKLWQKGMFKEYYTRLSDIIRSYIDLRYGLSSLESATCEILRDFKIVSPGAGQEEDLLRQVLELYDMVKFAKLIPDSSDCELSMEQAWSFVSITRKERVAFDETNAGLTEGGEVS
ncbi:MAG: hypothetical protein FJY11_02750 [Bacteroidetes bacterium]|nr:hypothetical protein [Bacteroidota bacterium]